MLPGDIQGAFTDILLKITVLAIVIGLFLNFFILQNYYIAIHIGTTEIVHNPSY